MVQLIKEKKKERQKVREDIETQNAGGAAAAGQGPKYSQEELEKLQYQLKEAENEKIVEEKKLKSQIQ